MMAGAKLFNRSDRGLLQVLVPQEAEVFVRTQHQHPLAISNHPGAVMLRDDWLKEVEIILFELRYAAIEFAIVREESRSFPRARRAPGNKKP